MSVKEIWESCFGNAILKLKRADEHIADIEKRLRSSFDSYPPSRKINGNTGEEFLYYGMSDRELRSDLALITADAIQNIHSALDFAWRGTLKRFSPDSISKYTKFPNGDGRKHLEGCLTKTGKVDPASSLFDLMVNRIKPYKGGDEDFLTIRALNNDDKHKLLSPVVQIVSVDGVELENEFGQVDVVSLVATDSRVGYRIPIPPGSHVKNNGNVAIQVKFAKGSAAEGLEVIPTLKRLAWKARRVVRTLQRFN